MHHWRPLLRAYALTGEDRFAAKVAAELDDWIARCPPPPMDVEPRVFHTTIPWHMLEVGLRLYGSWSEIPRYLVGTRWLDEDRASRLTASIIAHAERLSAFSPQLWPDAAHNHYLIEMVGLLYASALLPPQPPNANGSQSGANRDPAPTCTGIDPQSR